MFGENRSGWHWDLVKDNGVGAAKTAGEGKGCCTVLRKQIYWGRYCHRTSEVPWSTSKYLEVPGSTSKYPEVPWSISKCGNTAGDKGALCWENRFIEVATVIVNCSAIINSYHSANFFFHKCCLFVCKFGPVAPLWLWQELFTLPLLDPVIKLALDHAMSSSQLYKWCCSNSEWSLLHHCGISYLL